jgi:UDP-N-acetylglucosamine 2-epimerase (non-hydrolysing)
LKKKWIFIVGTSAELIKVYPVMKLLAAEGSVELWVTNQQPEDLGRLQRAFGTPADTVLRNPELGSLEGRTQVPRWLSSVLWRAYRKLRQEERQLSHTTAGEAITVLIHGDTLTSLVGAVAGRLAGVEVAHIEAGLRSHNWRHPFPEELIRRLNARFAHIHFAPDENAVRNLRRVRGNVVLTHGNTSIDTLNMVARSSPPEQLGEPFGLVSLHRAELLANQELFSSTIRKLIKIADGVRLIMVIDKLTQAELERTELSNELILSRIETHQKMAYHDFIKVLRVASFVITDSGGLQEECGNLELPCLVHRMHTERSDGLGRNARLSNWEINEFEPFIREAMRGKRTIAAIPPIQISPSTVICEHLKH